MIEFWEEESSSPLNENDGITSIINDELLMSLLFEKKHNNNKKDVTFVNAITNSFSLKASFQKTS